MTAAGPAVPRSAHGGAAYRRDIDGLRAVAVLSVILYHSRVPGFSGGFVGVDVFFVISGFLISSIIFRQLDQDRFSLARFYERRIRRIAPALTLVLGTCTVAALVFLLPTELRRFSKSLIATLLFSSNIFFWHTSGYFDTAATTKPLLHTWSLAIEEQFYLGFPLAALLVARYRPRARSPIFLLALLVSLAACIVLTRTSPDAAFYLPMTRGWELLVGVALASLGLPSIRSGALRTVLTAVGVGAVIVAVIGFTPATPFPGLAALLPTLGTALVIATDRADDPLAGRLLRQPAMVLIGRMSYSLYLWHWPVLVFFRQTAGREPSPTELAPLLAFIFVASAASWRFIEEPCRQTRGGIPYGRLVRTLAGVSAVLMLIAVGGWRTDGYAFLQQPDVNRYLLAERDVNPDRGRCFDRGVALMDRGVPCRLGPAGEAPSFIVWGDSHANALMPVLGALAKEEGVSGIFTGASGCVPLLHVRRIDRRDHCARLADSVVAQVRRRRLRDVIMVAYWSVYTDGWEIDPPPPEPLMAGRLRGDTTPPRAVFARALSETIEAVRAAGARVWIIEQAPSQPHDVPTWLARAVIRGEEVNQLGRPVAEHRARQRWLARTFANMADGNAVRRLDPATVLCPAERCLTSIGGRSLYADYNHLSNFGAMQLHDLFRPMLRSVAAARR